MDLIEGEFAGGYGANSPEPRSIDEELYKLRLIQNLTQTKVKTRWALALGLILKQPSGAYTVTPEGVDYFKTEL